MTSDDLTPEQAARLKDQAGAMLRYLNALTARMTRLGFTPDDPLFAAGIRARNAMQDLHMAAHYAGMKSGVWTPGK